MATTAHRSRPRNPLSGILAQLFWHIVLSLGALTMIGPFLWMLSTSLKAEGDVFVFPPEWIPVPLHWENYSDLLNLMPFGLFTFNSFKIAALAPFGQLLSCSLAAYAFARLRFPGREV